MTAFIECFDVVVVGSCNVDLISYVSRFPKAGETLCGSKFAMGCGGKGANQCVMASKLGARTAMIGCVGDDSFGDMFIKTFQRHHINTDHLLTIPNVTTGVAPITVNEQGENSIVIVKGANDCLSKSQLSDARKTLTSAKVALFQLEIDLSVTLHALTLAKENGVMTLFNPAPAVENLSEDFLMNSSILCCNETEAEILTGASVASIPECIAAINDLLKKGPERVVLTMGSQGAMFGARGGGGLVEHVTPSTQTKAVDTTGAGDCFVGSLAFFLANKPHLSFIEVVRRAVEIASISVRKRGTQTSYPTLEELPKDILS